MLKQILFFIKFFGFSKKRRAKLFLRFIRGQFEETFILHVFRIFKIFFFKITKVLHW